MFIILKAQWLSGLNLRLNDLFETYSTMGMDRRSENHSFSTFGPLPTVRGWTDEAKHLIF
ncbi:hypothetical protein [Globicatella sanguinis]